MDSIREQAHEALRQAKRNGTTSSVAITLLGPEYDALVEELTHGISAERVDEYRHDLVCFGVTIRRFPPNPRDTSDGQAARSSPADAG